MFQWLNSLFRRIHAPAAPIAVVEMDDRGLRCRGRDGTVEEVAWDEIEMIEILTNDGGPFVEDVYWVIHGSNRGCVVPQGATGCQGLLERLQQFQDFDNEAVLKAMCCTENGRFLIWRKEPAPGKGSAE